MANERGADISRAKRRRLQKEKKQENKQEIACKSRQRQWIGRRLATIILILLASATSYGFYNWLVAEPPGEFVPSLGNLRVPSLDHPHAPYNSDPPTSSPHLPSIASWGVHPEPVPKELQVHNLEDGGVVIQYNCVKAQDCNALQQQLEKIVRDCDHVVLAPYLSMDRMIALTAWNRVRKLDRLDENSYADSSKRISTLIIILDRHKMPVWWHGSRLR